MKLKINFTLKTGVTGDVPVLAILNYGYKEYDVTRMKDVYKPLKYYTGMKVTRKDWDEVLKQPTKKLLQVQLLKIEQHIKDVFHYLSISGELSFDKLKSALDEKIKGKTSETVKRVRIIDFILTDIFNDPNLKVHTRGSYKAMCLYLGLVEQQIGKPLYSNEFDEKIYKIFIEIVRSRAKRINSVASAYRLLRAALRKIAFTYKVPVFNFSEDLPASLKIRAARTQKVYLKFEQIQRLIYYTPSDPTEGNVKLILLTLLFTGVRYSDVFKVKPEYAYDENGVAFRYAQFVTTKNGKAVVIPFLKPLEDAIEQNNGQTAYRMNEQQFNTQCRKLIANCGIEEEQTLTYTDQNGQVQFETRPFYEFVSSHIGRRSFISNLINHIPVTVLSKITTHSSANSGSSDLADNSVIFSYNQTTLLENAALFVSMLEKVQEQYRTHFIFDLV